MAIAHSQPGPSSTPSRNPKHKLSLITNVDPTGDDSLDIGSCDPRQHRRGGRRKKAYIVIVTEDEPPQLVNGFTASPTEYHYDDPIAHSSSHACAGRCIHAEREETMDNLPGPGRGIDKLYQLGGRALERWMNRNAERLGFGPHAAEKKLLRSIEKIIDPNKVKAVKRKRGSDSKKRSSSDSSIDKRVEKDLAQGTKTLVRYTRSDIPSNQLAAVKAITTITTRYPHIRDYFERQNASKAINDAVEELTYVEGLVQFDPWDPRIDKDYSPQIIGELLSSSRKALLSVQDHNLNKLAKRLVMWRPSQTGEGGVSEDRIANMELVRLEQEWVTHGEEFLSYLTHPELSFLALRYLNNSIFHQPFIYDSSRGSKVREFLFKKLIELVGRLDQTNSGSNSQHVWSSVSEVRGLPFSPTRVKRAQARVTPPMSGDVMGTPHAEFMRAEADVDSDEDEDSSQRQHQESISLPITVEPSELVRTAERTLAIGWMISLSDNGDDDLCHAWTRQLESAVETQKLVVEQDLVTYADPKAEADKGIDMYVTVADRRFCYRKGEGGARIEEREISES